MKIVFISILLAATCSPFAAVAKQPGKSPVIRSIHSGSEGQAPRTPGDIYRPPAGSKPTLIRSINSSRDQVTSIMGLPPPPPPAPIPAPAAAPLASQSDPQLVAMAQPMATGSRTMSARLINQFEGMAPNSSAVDGVRRITVSAGGKSFGPSPLPAGKFPRLFDRSTYLTEILSATRTHGVEEALVRAVIHAESAYKPKARSHAGAQGLMQLMPGTARRFGVTNSYDPAQNIQGGVRYLAWLLDRYNGNVSLATAAYNAGEGAVDRYGGIPPYRETKGYVAKINSLLPYYRNMTGSSL